MSWIAAAAMMALATSAQASIACAWGVTILSVSHLLLLGIGMMGFRRSVGLGWLAVWGATYFWFLRPGLVRLLDDDWTAGARFVVADAQGFVTSLVAVAVFVAGFETAYIVALPPRILRRAARVLGEGIPFAQGRQLSIAAALVIVATAFYLTLSGGFASLLSVLAGGRAADRPWGADGNYGSAMSPLHTVGTALIVVSAAIAGLVALRGGGSRVARGLAWLLWAWAVAWIAAESGTRSTMLVAVASPMLAWFYARKGHGSRPRGKGSGYLVVAGLLVAVLLLGNVMRAHRSGSSQIDLSLEIQDADFLAMTALAAEVYETPGYELTRDSILLHILTGPVPRVLWKGKPEMEVMNTFSYYVWGVDIRKAGGNTLPSILGQGLLSWGWWGVLQIALGLGFAMGLMDSAARLRPEPLVLISAAIISMVVFVSFRMMGFYFFVLVYGVFGYVWLARSVSKVGAKRAP